MIKFYTATKYLWIISRIILIIFYGLTLSERLSETEIPDLIVNLLITIVLISMISISLFEFIKKKPHYSLTFFVGIINICIGVLMSYLLLTIGDTNYSILAQIGFQLLPIWIILYGFFEIIYYR